MKMRRGWEYPRCESAMFALIDFSSVKAPVTKEGLNAARSFAKRLPAFRTLAEAERELFFRRDRLLDDLARAASTCPTIRLDRSPESLKDLERWYFELLRGQGFESIRLSRDIFEQSISMYLGTVFVANRSLFKWIVNEYAFGTGRYEIGVASPQLSLMLTVGRDLEAVPKNAKHNSLWELFSRFAG